MDNFSAKLGACRGVRPVNREQFVNRIDAAGPIGVLKRLITILGIALDDQLRCVERLIEPPDRFALRDAQDIGDALRDRQYSLSRRDRKLVDLIGDDAPDTLFVPLDLLGFGGKPFVYFGGFGLVASVVFDNALAKDSLGSFFELGHVLRNRAGRRDTGLTAESA